MEKDTQLRVVLALITVTLRSVIPTPWPPWRMTTSRHSNVHFVTAVVICFRGNAKTTRGFTR